MLTDLKNIVDIINMTNEDKWPKTLPCGKLDESRKRFECIDSNI